MKNKPIIIIGAGISGLTLGLALLKKNIKCRKIWKPLSSFKVNRIREKFNNSEIISKKLMWLPSSLSLSFSELNEICRLIKIFFKNKN